MGSSEFAKLTSKALKSETEEEAQKLHLSSEFDVKAYTRNEERTTTVNDLLGKYRDLVDHDPNAEATNHGHASMSTSTANTYLKSLIK
jgi:hypothetical protein